MSDDDDDPEYCWWFLDGGRWYGPQSAVFAAWWVACRDGQVRLGKPERSA